MIKICELKIQKKFYDMIVSGQKQFEIRKMNKDYIKLDDVILFTDLEGNQLGFVTVDNKVTRNTWDLATSKHLDNETKEFIKNNYMNEKELIVFTIQPIEVVK